MGQNKQKSRRRYWATRSSVRSFARTAHSFACSVLLASLARSAALSHLRARSLHSLLSLWESEWLDGYLFCVFFFILDQKALESGMKWTTNGENQMRACFSFNAKPDHALPNLCTALSVFEDSFKLKIQHSQFTYLIDGLRLSVTLVKFWFSILRLLNNSETKKRWSGFCLVLFPINRKFYFVFLNEWMVFFL